MLADFDFPNAVARLAGAAHGGTARLPANQTFRIFHHHDLILAYPEARARIS
jgi:hypothetical protein